MKCQLRFEEISLEEFRDLNIVVVLNQVHRSSDVIPNYDVDNIVHNNVHNHSPNMFQLLFGHNANIAKKIEKFDFDIDESANSPKNYFRSIFLSIEEFINVFECLSFQSLILFTFTKKKIVRFLFCF